MAVLLAISGYHFGVSYEIVGTTTIGRASNCTIQLLDEKVSRTHSVIRQLDTDFKVEDAGSSNGTGVNGERINGSTLLKPGDEVGIGINRLLFNPEMQILRDTCGSGAVILVTRTGYADSIPPTGDLPDLPLPDDGIEPLLARLAQHASDPDEKGRPAALLQALVEALGGTEGCLLRNPQHSESPTSVVCHPPGSQVTLPRELVESVLEEGGTVTTGSFLLRFVVPDGKRANMQAEPGSSVAIPVRFGEQTTGIVYIAVPRQNALRGIEKAALESAVALSFGPLLDGDPLLLRNGTGVPHSETPIARSPAMQQMMAAIGLYTGVQTPLLLVGEPGTGKAFMARYVHLHGARAKGPFVSVHASSLPKGGEESLLFGHERGAFSGASERHIGFLEAATGGTLLIDEIARLNPALQVRLLRALQEERISRLGATRAIRLDFRFIAGTERDLKAMVKDGSFHAELYRMLSRSIVQLPPLRDRQADIEPLARRFMARFSARTGARMTGFTGEALELLEQHPWSRNVRDLQDLVDRVTVRAAGSRIEKDELLRELSAMKGYDDAKEKGDSAALSDLEKERVSRALDRSEGERGQAALLLGTTRPVIDRLIIQYELEPSVATTTDPGI
jgi:transcriptional regulator with AAA-type ATPase domain